MNLSELIRCGPLGAGATAIEAIGATETAGHAASAAAVACVAPIAVAPTLADDAEQHGIEPQAAQHPPDAPADRQPAHAGCAACCHRSRYGNCARPIEAGLSERFVLVAHPAGGAGCQAFERAAAALPPAIRGAIERIAAVRAWQAAELADAFEAAARCPDAADWLALAELVEATAGATDAGRLQPGRTCQMISYSVGGRS